MQDNYEQNTTPKKASLSVAIVFTVLVPGLGHIYSGKPRRAALIFGISLLGYCLMVSILYFLSATLLNTTLGTLAGIVTFIWPVIDVARVARKCDDLSQRPTWTQRRSTYVIILTANLVLAVFAFVITLNALHSNYRKFVIPQSGMEDTLFPREMFIAETDSDAIESIKRGDVIVFNYLNNEDLKYIIVERLIALPGDTVQIINKVLFLNGIQAIEPKAVKFTDSAVKPNDNPHPLGKDWKREGKPGNPDNFGPFVLPDGYMFVIGDNRDNSFDSRYFGPIPIEDIIGKAKLIYWSRDFNRIGLRLN